MAFCSTAHRRFRSARKPTVWNADATNITQLRAIGTGGPLGIGVVNDLDLTILRTRGQVSIRYQDLGMNQAILATGDQSLITGAGEALLATRMIDSKAKRKVEQGNINFSATEYLAVAGTSTVRLYYGRGIVTEQAGTAGSVPTPGTDADWDGWYFHTFFDIIHEDATGTVPSVNIFEFARTLVRFN